MIESVANLLNGFRISYDYSAYVDYQEVNIDDLIELPSILILVGEFRLDILIIDDVTHNLFIGYKGGKTLLYVYDKNGGSHKLRTYRGLFSYLRGRDGEMFSLSTLYIIADYMKSTGFSCKGKDIIQHIESKSMIKSARKV